MRVLVVGSGGREHALAWKLAQSPRVAKVFAAPGNAGIAEVAECVHVDASDTAAVAKLAEELAVDLTVVGPEAPLVAGLADEMIARGLPVFGPSAAAARIEGSKAWAKEILEKAGAPTARAGAFTSVADAVAFLDEMEPPYVVKADGLAAGKGVVVTPDRGGAVEAIRDALERGVFGDSGRVVVIEEFLHGEELSIFCLTDGKTVVPLAESQDFKRIGDGDEGPNTGGMGAYSPVRHLPADTVRRAVDEIFVPVVRTMEREGVPYRGLLYGGLMVTADGPKTFEFNCRFGDPETQVVLPRLRADLAGLLASCADGTLSSRELEWDARACASVVLASGGYPGSYETGKPIDGLAEVRTMDGVVAFHAGTVDRDGSVVTSGGRVLAVSALGPTLASARERAYEAADRITFEGKYYRRDIAARAARLEGEQ